MDKKDIKQKSCYFMLKMWMQTQKLLQNKKIKLLNLSLKKLLMEEKS